jgi:imidazolonepropionase-like amidohydrolase
LKPLVAIANVFWLGGSKGLPTIEDSIKPVNSNSIKTLGFEGVIGSIEIGKSADFVIRDISLLGADANRVEESGGLLSML